LRGAPVVADDGEVVGVISMSDLIGAPAHPAARA
jgi:CBS domain-containing protein